MSKWRQAEVKRCERERERRRTSARSDEWQATDDSATRVVRLDTPSQNPRCAVRLAAARKTLADGGGAKTRGGAKETPETNRKLLGGGGGGITRRKKKKNPARWVAPSLPPAYSNLIRNDSIMNNNKQIIIIQIHLLSWMDFSCFLL